MKRIFLYLAVLLALTATAVAGPKMTVKDTQGRAIEIELLGADEGEVSFRRVDTRKEFTVPMDTFDTESKAQIKKEAVKLAKLMPTIEADVIVSKRRYKEDSYYMSRQVVNSTVKLKNTSLRRDLPECSVKVVFIGRSQRVDNGYTVLAVREFQAKLDRGTESTTELEAFQTRYDRANRGYDNLGGYQYTGFLLVIKDPDGKIFFHHTTDPTIRKAAEAGFGALEKIADYEGNEYLDERMQVTERPPREPNVSF